MRLGGLITLVLAGTLAFAVPAHATTLQVNIGGNAFAPADVTVTQGDTVTWTWVGPDTNHSTTTRGTDGPGSQTTWDSDPGNPFPNHQVGDKFSATYQIEGEYAYFCKVHSFMTGKVTVLPKNNNPNPPAQDVQGPQFGTLQIQLKKRRIKFRLDEPAKVVGKMRGPIRKTLKVTAKAGTNYLKLPKKLKKGRYKVDLRATDASGNPSLVARAKFTIK
jgi:plastocyanin